MTVGELKDALKGYPDDLQVEICVNDSYDYNVISIEDSGDCVTINCYEE